jgi:hypothetical protein
MARGHATEAVCRRLTEYLLKKNPHLYESGSGPKAAFQVSYLSSS